MRMLFMAAVFLSAATPAFSKIATMDGRLPGFPEAGDFMSLQPMPDRVAPILPDERELLSSRWDGYAASVLHPEGPKNVVN